MIFKTSIAVEELVKSAGGVTASKNKGRAYFKVRTNPRNPQTVFQSESRSVLTSFSKRFKTLTNDKIAQWNEFAKTQVGRRYLGVAGKLSGINAYVRVNANLSLIGKPAVETPPESASFEALTLDLVARDVILDENSLRGMIVVFKSNPLATNQTLIVKASPMLSRGRNAKTTETRVISKVTEIVEVVGAGESALPLYTCNVFSDWQKRFEPNTTETDPDDSGNYQFEVYVIDNATGLASSKVNWIGELGMLNLKA